jgi:hypothetical protein
MQLSFSYIFLGCSRLRNVTQTTKIFEERAGNCVGQGHGGLMTPVSPFAKPDVGRELDSPPTLTLDADEQELEETLHDVGAPKSPFHYQLRKVRNGAQQESSPSVVETALLGNPDPQAVQDSYLRLGTSMSR